MYADYGGIDGVSSICVVSVVGAVDCGTGGVFGVVDESVTIVVCRGCWPC